MYLIKYNNFYDKNVNSIITVAYLYIKIDFELIRAQQRVLKRPNAETNKVSAFTTMFYLRLKAPVGQSRDSLLLREESGHSSRERLGRTNASFHAATTCWTVVRWVKQRAVSYLAFSFVILFRATALFTRHIVVNCKDTQLCIVSACNFLVSVKCALQVDYQPTEEKFQVTRN